MAPAYSCRVLEINIISAQDLAAVSKNMKTYAVAWVNTDPMRKLTTRVDHDHRANPIWNEKFVFRVDGKLLSLDASAIVIEIYTAAWAKDALIGTVNVLLSDLFAPWSGFDDGDRGGNSNMRLVTLQVRRPSGRLHGFIRLGVALLDGTQRSMPLSVEVADRCTLKEGYGGGPGAKEKNAACAKGVMLRRTHSDQTDLTTSTEGLGGETGAIAVRRVGGGGLGIGGGTDSMVNGSICSSDVGPSASVVAAAIAQGLYHQQKRPLNKDDASSILEGTTEGMEHKLQRWRKEKVTDVATTYENKKYRKMGSSSMLRKQGGEGENDDSSGLSGHRGRRKRRNKQRKKENKGLFSCFGNLFGCQISITCGGGDHSPNKRNSNNKVANLSAVDETFSQSAV